MRLTNHLRDCFVRAVSNDIPKPVEPTYDDIQLALYDMFSESIKTVYNNEDDRKDLNTSRVCIDGGRGEYLVTGRWDYKELPVYIAYRDACQKRSDVISKLRGVARGCNTLKQLQEALPDLPDLVKYMTDDYKKPTPGLPVVSNLYDDLKALGLPS